MSYGLYDGDLKLYPHTPFFNLELMKLSTYYKNKLEIVSFSPDFNPRMYTHFLVRQDFLNNYVYPPHPNVEYGGRAFQGNKYIPLPQEIEQCRPDNELYNKLYRKDFSLAERAAFNTMRRAEHVRLSLDGKTIWKDWQKQIRYDDKNWGIIIHDYNIGQIDGAYQAIKDNLDDIVKNSRARRVGMKFPVIIDNEKSFCDWFNLPSIGQYFNLQYDGIITKNVIPEITDNYIKGRGKQVTVNVTKNTSYDDFINHKINTMFKTILELRSYGMVFPLIYDKDFFANSQWLDVMKMIQGFNHHILDTGIRHANYFAKRAPYESLFSYYHSILKNAERRHEDMERRQKLINIFQFVRENNYELFKLFYETQEYKK